MQTIALDVRLAPDVVTTLDRVSANQREMNRLLAENCRLLEDVVKRGLQVVEGPLKLGEAISTEGDAAVPTG